MTTKIDDYVVDVLMPDLVGHDRHAAAFLVFLYLWRHHSNKRRTVQVSLAEIAEGTGLARRSVQGALKRLVRRRLVSVRRTGITDVPEYSVMRPWAGGN